MTVYELLTMVGKPRYKLQINQRGNVLDGGYFKQLDLEVDLLNKEVREYSVYPSFREIVIYLKDYS